MSALKVSQQDMTAFLGPLAIGVGGVWTAYNHAKDLFPTIPGALFVGGLVFTAAKAGHTLQKVKDSLDSDHALRVLDNALRITQDSAEPHVSAGLRTADKSIRTSHGIVEAFVGLNGATAQVARVSEPYLLNDFLEHLAHAIPDRSTWVGITKLTEGWGENDDPAFRGFKRIIQDRARASAITVIRIYVAHDQSQLDAIRPHLAAEMGAGIVVRTLVAREASPPDLTLLWKPSQVTRQQLEGVPDPIGLLKGAHQGLFCALEFSTILGRFVESVTIHKASSREADQLASAFDTAWRRAAHP